jgi:hypothetical protein
MTSVSRSIVAVAILVGVAGPAMAGQSANRTSSGVTGRPQTAAVATAESVTAARCRQHCDALAASASHQPHRTVTEKQASATACLRTMAK